MKAAPKDHKFGENLHGTKSAKKTNLNDNFKYTATKSRLPQPHHGSCSNIMAPAASLWLL